MFSKFLSTLVIIALACNVSYRVVLESVMLLMVVDAVTENHGEKRAVVSLTDEETTHTISVLAIFKKVPLEKVS